MPSLKAAVSPWYAVLAWLMAGVSLLGLVLSLVTAIDAADAATGQFAVIVAFAVFVPVFATVGTLLALRHPSNAVGWILLTSAVFYSVAGSFGLVAQYLLERGPLPPWGTAAAWVSSWAWMAAVGPSATFLLLLFPNGHLLSRRWRHAGYAGAAAIGLTIVSVAFMPGSLDFTTANVCRDRCANPFGIAGAGPLLEALGSAGELLLAVAAVSGIASLILRFLRAGPDQRLQLRWLLYSGVLFALAAVLSMIIETVGAESETAVNLSNLITTVGLSTIPVAIGVAVLRYRLYDIDLVINRTLVYGLLTLILSLVYFAAVTVLQQLLSPFTGSSNIAVAGSTLAVAALFGTARSNVQAFIDRRFYRRRYDAGRALAGFSMSLRTQTDIEAVSDGVLQIVNETMQPARASMWLRSADRRRSES